MERKNSHFIEHIDASIIARFPPGFFQKGMEHLQNHPDEEFVMQITRTKIFLRRAKKRIDGIRPKAKTNGRIITYCQLVGDTLT